MQHRRWRRKRATAAAAAASRQETQAAAEPPPHNFNTKEENEEVQEEAPEAGEKKKKNRTGTGTTKKTKKQNLRAAVTAMSAASTTATTTTSATSEGDPTIATSTRMRSSTKQLQVTAKVLVAWLTMNMLVSFWLGYKCSSILQQPQQHQHPKYGVRRVPEVWKFRTNVFSSVGSSAVASFGSIITEAEEVVQTEQNSSSSSNNNSGSSSSSRCPVLWQEFRHTWVTQHQQLISHPQKRKSLLTQKLQHWKEKDRSTTTKNTNNHHTHDDDEETPITDRDYSEL